MFNTEQVLGTDLLKEERNHRTTEPPAAPPKPASHQLLSLSSHMTMKMRLTAPRWCQGPSFTGWRQVDRGARAGTTPLGSGVEQRSALFPKETQGEIYMFWLKAYQLFPACYFLIKLSVVPTTFPKITDPAQIANLG